MNTQPSSNNKEGGQQVPTLQQSSSPSTIQFAALQIFLQHWLTNADSMRSTVTDLAERLKQVHEQIDALPDHHKPTIGERGTHDIDLDLVARIRQEVEDMDIVPEAYPQLVSVAVSAIPAMILLYT